MTDSEVGRRTDALRATSKTLPQLLEADERFRASLSASELPDRNGYEVSVREAFDTGGWAGLRLEKRRRLAQIAAFDLAGDAPLEIVGRSLSDLADACLQVTLEALSAPPSLCVIAMGKLGARELNYVSDIDVVFVAQSDLGLATKAAEELLAMLGGFSPQGRAYTIDTNLRPEGRNGALVRSTDGALEYYRRWAKPWEHQALIKARAAAGGGDAGDLLVEETRALVFPESINPDRITAIRKVKERVEDHTARRGRGSQGDNVKVGPGGLRDIEFAVQLFQLVHGGSDSSVRHGATLDALQALVDGGYIADDDGAGLGVAYRWLRALEHRLQLWQERRVHVVPSEETARARLARSMRFADSPTASAAARFDEAHHAVLADVRGRFEKLFYRPMIESLAESPGARLGLDALKERLRVLGFRDVDKAARTLEGLVSGTSRRSKLFRVLTPPLLRRLASSPVPDEGLLGFLRLGEALGGRLDALGAMRDNPPGLAFLAGVLGSGRLPGELLAHVPEVLQSIADGREAPRLKGRERLVREARASLEWRQADERLAGLRRFKRREMLGVILADLAGAADLSGVGVGLSDLADACLEAALEDVDLPFAVVGLGKLGGRELSYASDIDVVFVHAGGQDAAEEVAERVLRSIGELTPEGQAFRIDLDLRPEGRAGLLARSLDAYLEYYARWAKPWEHLALLKARPAAGDFELAEELITATRAHAFPEEPDPRSVAEIRHLKARMERERIPRQAEPRRHIKLGPGGMSDVEFAVQLLQMGRGAEVPELRTAGTLDALEAARSAGLIGDTDARRLSEAYTFLGRLRNALFLMVGRPVDLLPTKPETLEALGLALGFTDQPRQEVEERYLRVMRRARRIAEPLIYGD